MRDKADGEESRSLNVETTDQLNKEAGFPGTNQKWKIVTWNRFGFMMKVCPPQTHRALLAVVVDSYKVTALISRTTLIARPPMSSTF